MINGAILSEASQQEKFSCQFKAFGFTVEFTSDSTKIIDENGRLVADSMRQGRHMDVREVRAFIIGFIAGRNAARNPVVVAA